MNRRTWKDFLTKRSTIWTLSLCLVGVIVLGGIATVDNSRNKNGTQTETEPGQVAYLEEDLNHTDEEDGSIATDEADALEEVSGNEILENGASGNDTSDSIASEIDASDSNGSGSTASEIDASDSDGSDSAASENGTSDNTGTNDGTATDTASDEDSEEASSASIISEQALIDAGVSFTDEQSLLWPSAGTIAIDYSMDKSVYFATLNQYKYNPALVISSDAGNQVLASAKGIVESISIDEETGTTLVLNIGNGYRLTYGQLMEPAVSEGDVVEVGDLLAYISEPTKYYSTEGSNLYFAMTKDGEPVDPVLYLE